MIKIIFQGNWTALEQALHVTSKYGKLFGLRISPNEIWLTGHWESLNELAVK